MSKQHAKSKKVLREAGSKGINPRRRPAVQRARCASHLHCSPPSGSEEKRCFYIHPHPCVNAKRSSARVNGPPFHAARERDSSVKYSYCNPAGLRWHLDSLTQTLQVITRANDFEEFTLFSRVLRSCHRHMACLDLEPSCSAPWQRQLGILKQWWDVTAPVWLPGPGPGGLLLALHPARELRTLCQKRGKKICM